MSITNLFRSDPTRQLEEVQKVNARERAVNDVREFYETDSARNVLTTLGNLVDKYPHEEPRFLYISATFGSVTTGRPSSMSGCPACRPGCHRNWPVPAEPPASSRSFRM